MSIVAKLPTKRTGARTDRLGPVSPPSPRPARTSGAPPTKANGGRGRKPPKVAVAGQLVPDEAPRNPRGNGSRGVQPAPTGLPVTEFELAHSPSQTVPRADAGVLATPGKSASSNPNVQQTLALRYECYLNGDVEILTFKDAHRLLHECGLGWVGPDDWLRYAWGDHAWSGLVLSRIKPAGRRFGYKLLTSAGRHVTLEEFRREVLHNERASDELFQQHASRFNRLFPEELRRTVPLFKWWPTIDRNGYKVSAYRVLPERTTLVIAGTDPDTTPPGCRVNWPSFRVAPVDLAVPQEIAQSGE